MVSFGMFEHDRLIDAYEHLRSEPRAEEALHILRKIASLVKPIMRKRGWRIGILAEFFPADARLLGLNVNRGAKILVRLRYPGDRTQFLPLENVVDTLLHELSHNVFGPHDESFHNLWNELRDEYTDLKIKGYTGEGFLSEGRRLGGGRMPMQEMRRQARAAAEQRKAMQKKSGQKLGGRMVARADDIRSIIAEAAQRRQSITQGCASGNKDSIRIAEEASRGGFRTQAEEDAANEQAINEALWELVQEEEMRKAGLDPQSWRTEGLIWNPQTGLQAPAPIPPESPRSSGLPLRRSGPAAPSSSSRQPPAPLGRYYASPPPPVPASSKPAAHTRKPLPPPPPLNAINNAGMPVSPLAAVPPSKSNAPTYRRSRTSSNSISTISTGLVSPVTPRSTHHDFRPSTPSDPSRSNTMSSTVSRPATSSTTPTSNASIPPPPPPSSTPPLIDLSAWDDHYEFDPAGSRSRSLHHHHPPSLERSASEAIAQKSWQCPVCTLCNRYNYLCCEACGNTRPASLGPPGSTVDVDAEIRDHWQRVNAPRPGVAELDAAPSVPPPSSSLSSAAAVRSRESESETTTRSAHGWNCTRCTAFMEKMWWTCAACGKMKEGWQ